MNDYSWNLDPYEDHLSHHGIAGMKWGKRNGPPYPLTPAAHREVIASGLKGAKGTGTNTSSADMKPVPGSKSKRGDTLASAISAGALALVGTAANVGMAAVGFVNPGFAALTLGMYGATIASTIKLASGDSDARKAKKQAEEYKKERDKNPVEKESGLHKKTKEMSREEDMARINPEFKNWDENTKNNCAPCTYAYELRRRGYDVTAKKSLEGMSSKAGAQWFKGATLEHSEDGVVSKINSKQTNMSKYLNYGLGTKERKTLYENATKSIEKQGNGARGYLAVTWDKTLSGHAMAYEVQNGKLKIYDTQANKSYDSFDDVGIDISDITIQRLDNCALNKSKLKEFCE